MTYRRERSAWTGTQTWGKSPTLRWWLIAAGAALLLMGGRLDAAFTEPRLALLRVTAYRSSSGGSTLQLEGSFSYADTVQLSLPLNVLVTQGALTARFDLGGKVFISTGGGPEQLASGPGVVSFTERAIVLVLPPGFSAGGATAQVVANYGSQPISSNRLSLTL